MTIRHLGNMLLVTYSKITTLICAFDLCRNYSICAGTEETRVPPLISIAAVNNSFLLVTTEELRLSLPREKDVGIFRLQLTDLSEKKLPLFLTGSTLASLSQLL
jgi:hypothetical protein